MDRGVLKTISTLLQSDDPELRILGSTMYMGSDPSGEDIEELNMLYGQPPIGFTRFREQAKEALQAPNKNIF